MKLLDIGKKNDSYATDTFGNVQGPDNSRKSHSAKSSEPKNFRNILLVFSVLEARGSTKPNFNLTRKELLCKVEEMGALEDCKS